MNVNIQDYIDSLRENPKQIGYYGRPPVVAFYAFLHGYARARSPDHPEDAEFLADFNSHVMDRYRINSNQGWGAIIHFFSASDEAEIDLFWRLMDQFLTSRKGT